jgi:DNA-binding NtrC family response regulator
MEGSPVKGESAILVVDDDSDVLALIGDLLGRWGYQVLQAPSADVALFIMRQPAVTIDLIITDVVMGGELDGVDLAIEALKVNPEVRIVYMSGYGGVGAARTLTAPAGFFSRVLLGFQKTDSFPRTLTGLLTVRPNDRDTVDAGSG